MTSWCSRGTLGRTSVMPPVGLPHRRPVVDAAFIEVVAGLLAAGSPLANHGFSVEVGKCVRHACAVAGDVGAPCCDIN